MIGIELKCDVHMINECRLNFTSHSILFLFWSFNASKTNSIQCNKHRYFAKIEAIQGYRYLCAINVSLDVSQIKGVLALLCWMSQVNNSEWLQIFMNTDWNAHLFHFTQFVVHRILYLFILWTIFIFVSLLYVFFAKRYVAVLRYSNKIILFSFSFLHTNTSF